MFATMDLNRSSWRQGGILTDAFVRELQEAGELPAGWSKDDVVILISHSCDITAGRLKDEPEVECLRGRMVAGAADGSLTYGKNPRRLHIVTTEDNPNSYLDVHARDRSSFPRERLVSYKPDVSRTLGLDAIRQLAIWQGKRYFREAFPDEFNDRCNKILKKIRRGLKNSGRELTAVFVSLSSDKDLPPSEDYEILVVATARDDALHSESRQQLQRALNTIAASLDEAEGIAVLNADLVSEAEFSLEDLRSMQRWDFDDLSWRDDEAELPPESGG